MKKYLKQLRTSMLQDCAAASTVVSMDKKDYDAPLAVDPAPNISGDENVDVEFDPDGNAYMTVTQVTLGLTLHLDACIAGLDARFDIWLETNYPERWDWHNIIQHQHIDAVVRTKLFGSTTLKVKIHSSIPNSKANARLHYST